ncbi:MAG: hypothetical protein IPO36_00925 [Anaerolineales bacterium]|nr:hypothetical protein [Anaerolineales bacterium]
MTAKASGSRKLKRKSLPKFDHAIYSKISSINLIIYSVHYLLEHGIEVRMEDVVFGCFLLFPHKFGLKKYSRWPDSAVVSRRVSDCRGKGYIAANTDFGFKLTVKGIRVAERVARALGVVKPKKIIIPPVKEKKKKAETHPPAIQTIPVEKATKPSPTPVEKAAIAQPTRPQKKLIVKPQAVQLTLLDAKKAEPVPTPKPARASEKKPAAPTKKAKTVSTTIQPAVIIQPVKAKEVQPSKPQASREEKARAAKFVRSMEASDAYRLYKKNGKESRISEFDFRSLLLCTMESSSETLTRNVELFKGYARIHERQDLLTFLGYCEMSFETLLKPGPAKKIVKKK